MHKIIVSVFDSEQAAFQGVTALKDLHHDGDITLYASSVVKKDANGWVSVLQSDDRGPVGTLAGLVGGSLVGLLGGPVGVAVGAYAGTMGGALFDLFNAGVGMDFINEVAAEMAPGKVAVVADADESWVTPVETRLGALGATTFRRLPDEVIDEGLVRESQSAKDELDQLQAELRASTGEARAKVEAAITAQRTKLATIATRIDTTLATQRSEFEARLSTLQAQRAKAREQQKARIDARIDELKASHAARRAKLEQARELAKQSAALTREALLS
jgi:uncharacterized membrane protein